MKSFLDLPKSLGKFEVFGFHTSFNFVTKHNTIARIFLLSDTHSHIDDTLLRYASEADEIWHAGDIGDESVIRSLEAKGKVRAVYGNIDDVRIRQQYPEDQRFTLNNTRIWMTHIGGHPGRYAPGIAKKLIDNPVDVFICGHSHIVKAGYDQKHKVLHLNPGAAGKHGWHKMRTAMRFVLEHGKVTQLELIELGLRGSLANTP